MDAQTAQRFNELYTTIKKLRDPNGGCPWDIEQTPLTLRSTLLEETYEAIDALEDYFLGKGSLEHTAEELGDIMINIVMIAYMFEQEGLFSVADMLYQVNDKLIRRHPHVFGKTEGFAAPDDAEKPKTADTVLAQWDKIKEIVEGRAAESILDSIPKNFPPLIRAYKLQKKAAKKGFDWHSVAGTYEKIDEEVQEFKTSIAEGVPEHIEEEFGDLLFSLINTARHLHIDPAVALNRANAKFERRFRTVEKEMQAAGLPLEPEHVEQMELFWEKAKQLEKND